MEGNKNKPRALLVFGAPGCGKTTFGEKFAKKYGLAFYDFDEISSQDGFSRDVVLKILSLITRTKHNIIFEGCLRTEKDRIEIRNLLRECGYEPSLIWIQTDTSTIRNRLKSKYKSVSKAKDVYSKAVDELEAPDEIEHPIILSGKHTFETQSRHVVAGLADLAESK